VTEAESRPLRPVPPRLPRPVMTLLLVLINVLLFLLMEQYRGGSENLWVLDRFGALERNRVWEGEYYRLLTAMFLHIGFVHILSNLFALYLLGRVVEPFYGRLRFLLIYLLSGLSGNVVSMLFLDGVSAGASGAILGLAGALLSRISYVKGRVPEPDRRFFFFMILFLISLDMVLGFTMAHVNNGAHVGGLLAGWWISYAMVKFHDPKPHRRWRGWLWAGSYAVVLLIAMPLSFHPVWNADYLFARGRAFHEQKEWAKAAALLEKAVERDPGLRQPYAFLARYHFERENLEKALRYGRRAAADAPGDPSMHELLERSYRRLENEPAAEAEWEFALNAHTMLLMQNSGSAVILNNFAYSLAERGVHLNRALQMARLANEKTEYNNPLYLDTLAWVLYRQGRYAEAELWIRSVADDADEPIYDFHLGAILLGGGKAFEGQRLIERAIDQGLDWWNRQEAERLLHDSAKTA